MDPGSAYYHNTYSHLSYALTLGKNKDAKISINFPGWRGKNLP
jgi:hypothetical protein